MSHPCPACGYCEHCGRSNQPPMIPAPRRYPYTQPWTIPFPVTTTPYPTTHPTGPIWISQPHTTCGTNTFYSA